MDIAKSNGEVINTTKHLLQLILHVSLEIMKLQLDKKKEGKLLALINVNSVFKTSTVSYKGKGNRLYHFL